MRSSVTRAVFLISLGDTYVNTQKTGRRLRRRGRAITIFRRIVTLFRSAEERVASLSLSRLLQYIAQIDGVDDTIGAGACVTDRFTRKQFVSAD